MRRLYFLVALLLVSVSAQAEAPVILVFGDSISAGYGLDSVAMGWVELLRARLKMEGYGYQVVNASVSGETTAGALARLPRALQVHRPQIVILELGGNDGLRALPLQQMRENFARMIELATQAGAQVLLLGMRIPPNYGPQYTSQFELVYRDMARVDKLPLVPFLMDHIAMQPELMQNDDIHPNVKGQPILLDNVWPALRAMLRK